MSRMLTNDEVTTINKKADEIINRYRPIIENNRETYEETMVAIYIRVYFMLEKRDQKHETQEEKYNTERSIFYLKYYITELEEQCQAFKDTRPKLTPVYGEEQEAEDSNSDTSSQEYEFEDISKISVQEVTEQCSKLIKKIQTIKSIDSQKPASNARDEPNISKVQKEKTNSQNLEEYIDGEIDKENSIKENTEKTK